jgi:hypothetical protein
MRYKESESSGLSRHTINFLASFISQKIARSEYQYICFRAETPATQKEDPDGRRDAITKGRYTTKKSINKDQNRSEK